MHQNAPFQSKNSKNFSPTRSWPSANSSVRPHIKPSPPQKKIFMVMALLDRWMTTVRATETIDA